MSTGDGEGLPRDCDSRLRADARRNLERIVVAAGELSAERGLDVTVAQIAARAGVGVGEATVYRSFPGRDDLLAAAAADRMQWYEQRRRRALRESDAEAALVGCVTDVFEQLRTDRGLGDALRAAAPTVLEAAARPVRALATELRTSAIGCGTVGRDVTGADLHLLITGLA